jgi:hypothetical protein
MSIRCGMLLIQMREPIEKELLLPKLGFGHLTPATVRDEFGQVMSNADDHIVSVAALGSGWISLWGQYDFNLLPDVSAKHLLPQLRDAKTVIYYAVEGTSGALVYERYDDSALTSSYFEIEGKPEAKRCVGTLPPRDQLDEWSLLEFAMPAEVTYECISETKHEHFRFRPAPE